MSSIAYITDSKMLEMHRLNAHKEMNFWRLSKKINFSDFKEGDLIFFLSKDKELMNKKEKGIIGYGRLKQIHLLSINTMWKKFGKYNGYNNLDEFKEALNKINKGKSLPDKISSFYLENVSFFQAPIYLSECGMNISHNVESYIYLKPEDVSLKILDHAKKYRDLWSSGDDYIKGIQEDELIYKLKMAYRKINDYKLNDKLTKKAYRELKKYNNENGYNFIDNSKLESYKLKDNNIEIVLYNNKEVDKRLIIGQAILYKKQLPDITILFRTINNDKELESLLNQI